MSEHERIILQYLENSYTGARMLDDISAMTRIARAIASFEAAPSAEKKGKWLAGDKMEGYPRIPYKPWKTYCSCCGEEAYNGDTLFDYCPHCGARMEESDE